ncbi:DoxX family protein [Allosphingosinicella deserti]|uniref:Polyhydroxyalkanoate depolymerase n=1 Tax=Allosphingosinicella deserti TaxID=2116704 RepID=A0A2P7R082_9SPHN|nr:polyhydroxyalkanoate depolymerase [Sphingomonas deserti]
MQRGIPTALWSGRVLTTLFALFMAGGSIAPKLLGAQVASQRLVQLGWPPAAAFPIGLVELACLLLFLWSRTSLLGAVLMTGLLGGAMATHLRAASPFFSHSLFSVYLGAAMWAGLWLRDPAVRAVLPLHRNLAPARHAGQHQEERP